jgi:hypothetical protein
MTQRLRLALALIVLIVALAIAALTPSLGIIGGEETTVTWASTH